MAATGELVAPSEWHSLPNIPGIRRNPVVSKRGPHANRAVQGEKHTGEKHVQPSEPTAGSMTAEEGVLALDIFRNTSHVKEVKMYADLTGRYAMRNQKRDYLAKVNNLPFGAEPQRLPRFIEFDKKTLKYHAWYKEAVPESPLESERVHKCDIYYYLEDHTVQVLEHRQPNSGLPQGDLIKRLRIPKPDSSGFFSDKDFYIGAEVTLFGKTFQLVDANESTRQHMSHIFGVLPGPALPYPSDAYTAYYTAKMQRETGGDPTISRNRKMHPMKEYMESILGKPVKMQDLGSFLEHDKKVLRFHAVWDDRDSLYGDLLRFKIHYYLVDDTMEIVPQFERNCGRDRIGKLLSRSKIVKPNSDNHLHEEQQPQTDAGAAVRKEQHYHWRDLTVGSKVRVFGRELMVLSADGFTREFLEQEGQPLGPELVLPEDPVPKYARPIPPHTGYGSDEDTLKNCFSFDPKPPLKDGAKAILNSGKILRYGARILSNHKDDQSRFFVILFFLEDDTIAIREPPIRNSGFTGGNFLARTKLTSSPCDLFVGAVVQVVAHTFELVSADDYTLNYMESRSHEGWPRSNIYRILDTIRPHTAQLRNIIVRLNHPTGRLSYKHICEAVRATGVQLDQQEELTLTRTLDPLKKGIVPSYRLIKNLEAAPVM